MATRRQTLWRSWSWLRGARVAALSVAAGLVALSPLGGGLEETYGLGTLFRLRGPGAAPDNVVVVALDRASADRLGLPTPLWRGLRLPTSPSMAPPERQGTEIIGESSSQ